MKAAKDGTLKPMSKAEVAEWRARMEAIPDEQLADARKQMQEDVDNSDSDDWGV